MSTRDILDAIAGIKEALDNIWQTIDGVRDSQGRVSGTVVDVEAIERYRNDYRTEFDEFEYSYKH